MADEVTAQAAVPESEIKDSAPPDTAKNSTQPLVSEKASEKEEEAKEEVEQSSRANGTEVSKDTAIPGASTGTVAPPVPPVVEQPSQAVPPIIEQPSAVSLAAATAAATAAVAAARAAELAQAGAAGTTQQQPRAPLNIATIATSKQPLATAKKRKLSTTPPPPQSVAPQTRPAATSSSRPLVDPVITKAVHDIMGLLQTYGPLSYAQLEYNLPPSSCLQDVLQVMVTLGVVQVVDDDNAKTANNATTRYCMIHGKPRADVISSQQLVEDVADAQLEIASSEKRCALLKQALLMHQSSTSTSTTSAREVLKQVLLKYPEVANDPVYVAAFRNTHVDVAAVERERLKQERNQAEKKEKEAATPKKVSVESTSNKTEASTNVESETASKTVDAMDTST